MVVSEACIIHENSITRAGFLLVYTSTMPVTMTMTQPAKAPPRFVEQASEYHLDAAGPDPELKKILPLVFASLEAQINPANPDDAEIFAPFFVDKTQGTVKKSVSAQKILPIATDNLLGISSYFSGFHPGLDYRAKVGSPIHAILPGVVNEIAFEIGGYGRYVVLMHHVDGKTLFSLYAHLKVINVRVGESVEVGEKLGEVGLTGRTTGPHLHFELHDTKRAIDPLRFFSGSSLAMAVK